jgi:hypothetical protein
MDKTTLKTKVAEVTNKREFLLELLEKPSLGNLRIDVNQALEELDELIEEYQEVFPEEKQ